jgi:predicted secreted protein
MSELDSLRGRAKPFFYCGGQGSRIISVKNLLIAISSFLLIFLGGVTLAAASEVTALQAKDNGREILVKVGTIIELSLEKQGGTGYTWESDQLDKKRFQLMKTETRPLSDKIGAPVLMTWWLKVKNAGESQLAMEYFRPWEGKCKAVEHFRVKVNIQ